MHEELKSSGSPEIVLSRTITHALNAFYNRSEFSYYMRNDVVNNVYKKIIGLIDVDETFKKIEKRISELSGKVFGPFGGTPIEINGKNVRVSGKVAEVYEMLQNAKTKKYTNKLMILADIVALSERETSITTSDKSYLGIRDDTVWQFFGQMNELFVVKEDASIDLLNTQAVLRNPVNDQSYNNRSLEEDSLFLPKNKRR